MPEPHHHFKMCVEHFIIDFDRCFVHCSFLSLIFGSLFMPLVTCEWRIFFIVVVYLSSVQWLLHNLIFFFKCNKYFIKIFDIKKCCNKFFLLLDWCLRGNLTCIYLPYAFEFFTTYLSHSSTNTRTHTH